MSAKLVDGPRLVTAHVKSAMDGDGQLRDPALVLQIQKCLDQLAGTVEAAGTAAGAGAGSLGSR